MGGSLPTSEKDGPKSGKPMAELHPVDLTPSSTSICADYHRLKYHFLLKAAVRWTGSRQIRATGVQAATIASSSSLCTLCGVRN